MLTLSHMISKKLFPSPRWRRLHVVEVLLSRGHLNTSPVRFVPVVWKGAPTSSLEDIKGGLCGTSKRNLV